MVTDNENAQTIQLSPNQNSTVDQQALIKVSWIGLILLAVISTFVLLFLLLPFYGSGGYYPGLQPGWYPDRPHEFYSISRFQGTIWEGNKLLSNLFWIAACQAWCLSVPTWCLAIMQTIVAWSVLPKHQRAFRTVVIASLLVIGLFWIFASFRLLEVAVE